MLDKIGNLLLTAAIGANDKETLAGGVIAVIGTTIAASLGGWDTALKLLVWAMIIDYATGVLGALKGKKKLDSDVMFWGGIRKAVVLVVVALAVMLDQFMGNDSPVFRTIAMYFYIGREGLSIVENLGKLNVPVPGVIKDKLQQLSEDGDKR